MNDEPSQELLAAAIEAVSSYGLRRTSLSDVAAMAGVSRTTAYRAFGDRRRMLTTVWSAELSRMLADFDASLSDDMTAAEVLTVFFERMRGAVGTHPIIVRALRDELDAIGPALVERTDGFSFITYFAPKLAEVMERRLRPGAIDVTSQQLAEMAVRTAISFLFVPTSAFADLRSVAEFLARGASRPELPPRRS